MEEVKEKLFDEPINSSPIKESICVDASCLGNPGPMEYQMYDYKNKKMLYRSRIFKKGTNIIGEFLAIVHGLIWIQKYNLKEWVVYSDCFAAIQWVKNRRVNTTLEPDTQEKRETLEAVAKAVHWITNNHYDPNSILKWDTQNWGEIPADFGRK